MTPEFQSLSVDQTQLSTRRRLLENQLTAVGLLYEFLFDEIQGEDLVKSL